MPRKIASIGCKGFIRLRKKRCGRASQVNCLALSSQTYVYLKRCVVVASSSRVWTVLLACQTPERVGRSHAWTNRMGPLRELFWNGKNIRTSLIRPDVRYRHTMLPPTRCRCYMVETSFPFLRLSSTTE